jgi:hypothetical protein
MVSYFGTLGSRTRVISAKLTASPQGTPTTSDSNEIAFQTPSEKLMRQWQVSTEEDDRFGPEVLLTPLRLNGQDAPMAVVGCAPTRV